MAVTIKNTFEGTSGTTLDTSNTSGGGDAAQAVTIGTGATLTYSTAQAHRGSSSAAIAHPSSSEASFIQWTLSSAAATTRVAMRAYVWSSTWGNVVEQILTIRSSASNMASVGVTSDAGAGKFVVNDAASASLIVAPNAFPTSQWVRVEMAVTPGSSTTTGRIEAAYYLNDSTTAVWSYDSGATVNGGTGPSLRARVGRASAVSFARTTYFDDMQATDTLTSGFIGVPAANVAPTVSAGANQTIASGATATLSGTATDSDGTISSVVWTCTGFPSNGSAPNIANSTSNTATVTPAVAGVYTFQFSATDNGGASSVASTTVYVTSSSVTATSLTSNTGWTGAVSALQDTDDTTYIESSTATGEKDLIVRLAPIAATSQLTVNVRLALSAAQTNTTTLTLLEGSTVRKTITVTPTTTMSDYPIALSASETAAITSFNALDVKIAYTT